MTRNAAHKIDSVQFTCEGYDYFQFLGRNAPDKVVALYQKWVSPAVKKADLFNGNTYNRLNRWTTADGVMHLTNGANNLFAEVFLAASATVRRKKPGGGEHTQSIPLIQCARYGEANRNSDPNIGSAVNALARQGRMITLANPVGLYIGGFDGSGFRLPDGSPAGQFFQIVRGVAGRGLRAVYELPPNVVAAGLTVEDVTIGGKPIKFGGQIAEKVTMKLTGVASVATDVHNAPVACGGIPQVNPGGGVLSLTAAAETLPLRGGD